VGSGKGSEEGVEGNRALTLAKHDERVYLQVLYARRRPHN
jgi:hypothetical protein